MLHSGRRLRAGSGIRLYPNVIMEICGFVNQILHRVTIVPRRGPPAIRNRLPFTMVFVIKTGLLALQRHQVNCQVRTPAESARGPRTGFR